MRPILFVAGLFLCFCPEEAPHMILQTLLGLSVLTWAAWPWMKTKEVK